MVVTTFSGKDKYVKYEIYLNYQITTAKGSFKTKFHIRLVKLTTNSIKHLDKLAVGYGYDIKV